MVSPTVRGRGGTGTGPRPRAVTAAARAAAKRSEKAHGPRATGPNAPGATAPGGTDAAEEEPAITAGRTITVDPAETLGTTETAGTTETTAATSPAGKAGPARTTATPRTAARSAPARSATLSAVLAALVVVGLIAVTLLGLEYRDAEQSRQARTDALAAAQKAAPVILSYDYRRLDRDFAAANAHLTGSFRDKYRKTTTKVVMPTAKKYRGVVKATVARPPSGRSPAASVVSSSPERVVVLLFMNQVTKSTQISGPRLDLNRVRMTLVPAQDTWKVSAVDAL